jgi:thiol:disulfide interchange protein
VEAAAVELEAQIAQLQSDLQVARASAERTSKQLADVTLLYENRIKWRVSRQLRSDTYKLLLEARKSQRDAERAVRDVDKRYEAAVANAATAATRSASASAPASQEYGVVQVDVGWAADSKRYAIPVRVKSLQAQLPPLQGVTLRQTHAAGLWDEVKGLEVAQAKQLVSERFNWHFRQIKLGGLELGGGAVLQLTPCILPLLLLLLLSRMRAVSSTYNPFRTRVKSALPRVGFRTRVLDALAIVVLPLVAAVLAVASLMIVGQLPALPLLAAVFCLLLGGYAFVKLGELQRLMEDVVRSHSVPPPDQQPQAPS